MKGREGGTDRTEDRGREKLTNKRIEAQKKEKRKKRKGKHKKRNGRKK